VTESLFLSSFFLMRGGLFLSCRRGSYQTSDQWLIKLWTVKVQLRVCLVRDFFLSSATVALSFVFVN
jgi:hypothetical protein